MNEDTTQPNEYVLTGSYTNSTHTTNFTAPQFSEWVCECFGCGGMGITIRPLKGKEPNWFWRKMQYLCFGNRWYKTGESNE
ncbi:hypothetical protein UFOVP1295_24 [uncultured Caudovirales phage]|uniref:Uncharacterized protein n=1 Tax=uncultured Caudovirales phage TaxID=2100421 RepID=A0A6J5RPL1_9CAUD|nr:hypothetical protein UFOVP1295_24 [uncultured Caudovirales phage]